MPESLRRAGILFDKKGVGGSAAQGFEAIRSGAGKKVEDPGFRDESSQGREDGGADAVLRRAEAR